MISTFLIHKIAHASINKHSKMTYLIFSHFTPTQKTTTFIIPGGHHIKKLHQHNQISHGHILHIWNI